MRKAPIRVSVTGGAGQIAYSLLFRIANGDMFGADQPIDLYILDIPEMQKATEGVKMELLDCAFPLLKEVQVSSDPHEAFDRVQYALLVGARPRGSGMERGELLSANGKIFVEQGKALNSSADPNVKVLVVGNPCNTNCWIAMKNAPRIPRSNFFAMMRLDQNRAQYQLAAKAKVPITEVTNVTIWGNHSSTQVPDYFNAKIQGKPALEVIKDKEWFDGEFIPTVQKRGAVIIDARGKSSAGSAAQGIVDTIKALVTPTAQGNWFSLAVYSEKNPYGIDNDLIFSFPCRSKGDGSYEIVSHVALPKELQEKLKRSEMELLEEREIVKEAL